MFLTAVSRGAAFVFAVATLAVATHPAPAQEQALTSADLAEPTSPITITYAGAAYSASDIQPVLDAFHKAHPNITVLYQSVPFEQFNSILATRLSNSDSTLDVFDTDMPRTSAYATRGWLADVSGVFGDLSKEIDPGSIGAATSDGKLVAMPYQTSENILYFNRKLLGAAKIPSPSAAPSERLTWEQITKDAEAAHAAGAKWGVLFDQIDRYYQLEPLPISAGGSAGGKGDRKISCRTMKTPSPKRRWSRQA